MTDHTTFQSDTGTLNTIILRHARDAFVSQAVLNDQWRALNYTDCPDYDRAIKEYDCFVESIAQSTTNIRFLPPTDSPGIDSIYVRDTMLTTNRGIILCNMGKEARRGEPAEARESLEQLDIPILGAITDPGTVEGGDIIWLDEQTIVVGLGYRTNAEGIRQLTDLTRELVKNVITVPLPHWNGPSDVLHLMSFISPIDVDLAVVYSRLMPVPFRMMLLERGIRLVEVPDNEYESMACNVLALGPRQCLMLSGNPITQSRLEKAGAGVTTYDGVEISRKGAGGPTCLTRPLARLR
ncbi:MAG: amidinotransferase [candidate division Zixibacteria bacterium]|nr:amidinotransferase [candidate division Zixibacteria bacterium]